MLFNTLSQFVNYKNKCIFCGSTLVPEIENFLLSTNLISKFGSLKDGYFHCFSSHINAYLDLNNIIAINSTYNNITSYTDIELFDKFKPHAVLNCKNNKCKLKYSIGSNFFTYSGLKVNPFLLYYESCIINKMLVKTDYIYNTTTIIPLTIDSYPINVPFMDLSQFDKEGIESRLNTIFIFR
jgi:hypothetical protein